MIFGARMQRSHGAPTPQSQASNRLLKPFHGRSGWVSHTQPVSSHVGHFISLVPARQDSMRWRGWGSVASSLVRQHIVKVAHIDPATARGALYEMLPLVLRFATAAFADDCLSKRPPKDASFDAKSGLTFLITHLPSRAYACQRRSRLRSGGHGPEAGRAVV
jgi:hypothetical protein